MNPGLGMYFGYAARRVVHRMASVLMPRGEGRAIVLMYHRVADEAADPWGLAVSREHFRDHLAMLRREWNPVSVGQLIDGLRGGELPRRAVAVTFDDGYADNLTAAAPELVVHEVPATLFVTSGLIGACREPWWDELQRMVLEPERLPERLLMVVGGVQRSWVVPAMCEQDRPPLVSRTRPWKASRTSRLHFYYELWLMLRPLVAAERDAVLDEIAQWSGTERSGNPNRRTMTLDELREFARQPLLSVGGHTSTHPPLTSWSVADQRREIEENLEWLRRELPAPIEAFSYPYGDWSEVSARLVRAAGYRGAFTTEATLVRQRGNLYALPRLAVPNQPADDLHRQLESLLR